ncbi:MAG: glycosyltransferase family 39 protein, partial [Actinobacteria bacterium]|nr:glycosyltransferase family 39 protein [Actinomycetota bacterium]
MSNMSISRLLCPKVLLILICIFFLTTRFYKITEIPASVYWDEASIGYNAYSILETGKDEWGKSFPIHFRAFGEFKLPVFIYATVLSIKFFGLNEFSVRFPAVLFSLGIVILTYLLSKKISDSAVVGLLSSFFISISPWFFIFSRTGYEATAGLMFYLLAIYIFLKSNKNAWYILFSIISFILSAYSYNSFRVLVLPAILILIIYNIKSLSVKSVLPLLLSLIFLGLSIIPIYRVYVYDAGASRLQTIGAANTAFVKNYLSHFSLDFLILQGDKNLRSQQSGFGFGQLYLPELIFLPLGLIYIIKAKSKYRFLPLVLLLLGPVPAAITKESPHALRAISSIPFFCIISAMGINFVRNLFKKIYLIEVVAVVIFLAFFINYFVNFLNIYPVQSSKDWQYGYKKIFTDFKKYFVKYDRVIISDEYAQPYIFSLFYQKIDPTQFRQTVIRNNISNWGFSTVSSFNKFEFGKTDQLLGSGPENSLVFTNNKEEVSTLTPQGIIKFL